MPFTESRIPLARHPAYISQLIGVGITHNNFTVLQVVQIQLQLVPNKFQNTVR